ncbi:MAG TPA: hypothetical protein VGB85_02495, partial [Nannocystis sp.]
MDRPFSDLGLADEQRRPPVFAAALLRATTGPFLDRRRTDMFARSSFAAYKIWSRKSDPRGPSAAGGTNRPGWYTRELDQFFDVLPEIQKILDWDRSTRR